jgi:hypothetical protein
MDFRPFRRRFGCAVAVLNLVSLAGNCNPGVNGSATWGRDATLKTGKSSVDCGLAGENSAAERMPPLEAGSDPPTRAEV